MRNFLIAVALLAAGAGAGFLLNSKTGASGRRGRDTTVTVRQMERRLIDNNALLDALRKRIAELEGELAAEATVEPEPDAAPVREDSLEDIERLLLEAYEDNNVDWLLEVIERLLLMGERGYPMLRRLLMDIFFGAKFLPSKSDFRTEQIYKGGKIFANHEKKFLGFLNYLLRDKQTPPIFRQGAMMGAAFYVGSKAPGSEELQQTLMELFMSEQGIGGGPLGGFLPGNMSKRMQVFAMAMSGDREMIGPLHRQLDGTKDKRMQSDIIGALAYLGDPKAVPLIKERLNPAEGDFKREIESLGRVGTDEARETASTFLRSIPDTKRFYRHATGFVRSGGGSAGVLMIKERFEQNPNDPEVGRAIGTLRRYPTTESRDTLQAIAASSPDEGVAKRAAEAAAEVERRLKGEAPDLSKLGPRRRR